jgi:nucleotide-binding universal stress UspA family protein
MASTSVEKSAMVGAATEPAAAHSETAKAKPKRQEFTRDMSPSQDIQTTADRSECAAIVASWRYPDKFAGT